jgi:hypothetical protein
MLSLSVIGSNSDLEPILQSPTTVGVAAGLNSGSAVTIKNEPGLELWRAVDGWGYEDVC